MGMHIMPQRFSLAVKRAYDPAMPGDGYRVLVDRLWPRGLRKEDAHIDAWEKELAPSAELRRWYGHDPERWEEFQVRYREELERPQAQRRLMDLRQRAARQPITFLTASRAVEISDAVVLRDLLPGCASEAPPPPI